MTFKKPSKKEKHIRLRTLSFWFSLVGCGLLLGMLAVIKTSTGRYERFVTTANDYMQLELQANAVKTASDYLTEQARMFVQTMDLSYAEAYFEEANVARRREAALEALQEYPWSQVWDMEVQKAVQISKELMVQEIYAMKLVSAAKEYAEEELPEEIRKVQLSAEDAAQSREAMLEKAEEMLYDTQYLLTKNEIYDSLHMFTEGMLLEAEGDMSDTLKRLDMAVEILWVLITLGILMLVIHHLVIDRFIIKPLRQYREQMEKKKRLDAALVAEIDELAKTHNRRHR